MNIRRMIWAGLLAVPAMAQTGATKRDALHDLSDSIQTLSKKVHTSVVQVFSTGYSIGSDNEDGGGRSTGLVTKQKSTGSGVILSADGYIVTNNHVVQGARTVKVLLAENPGDAADMRRASRLLDAEIVGTDRTIDLAVLKIQPKGPLPALKLADSDALKQGQIVLAFGNPLGLENSVSLGVVSSVARQIKPDDPMSYIQTDAPINPGNSGGPLLDSEGHVVGINTFILSQSGGSEGIGFAIPSNIVDFVYQQILKDGHVHRGEIGVRVQTVTPELAAGLGLKQEWGAILGDVDPDGASAAAGLFTGDLVVALNGKQVESARQFEQGLFRLRIGDMANIEVMRGDQKLAIPVKVQETDDDPFRFADLVKPENNTVKRLGIVGIAITQQVATIISDTRFKYGVIVAARAGVAEYNGQGGLNPGDVIYSVNTRPISTLEALRGALDQLKPGDPLVVQIERGGKLMYLVLSEE